MKHVVPTFLIWMIILCGTSSAQSATAILRLSADYRIAETDSLPVKVTLPGLHFEKHEHSEFEALEWQVRLHAPDKGEVPLFKDIPSADFVVHFPDVSPTVVHWLSGSLS